MDLTIQLHEIIDIMQDDDKVLLMGLAKRLIGESEWADDELTEDDLRDIEIARQELARGEAMTRQQWKARQK